MVRILALKRLHNLSNKQLEYQLPDRMTYQRLCNLANSTNIPDRTTIWTFEDRIGETEAEAIFAGVKRQLLKAGHLLARGRQIIEAMPIPAPKQRFTRDVISSSTCTSVKLVYISVI